MITQIPVMDMGQVCVTFVTYPLQGCSSQVLFERPALSHAVSWRPNPHSEACSTAARLVLPKLQAVPNCRWCQVQLCIVQPGREESGDAAQRAQESAVLQLPACWGRPWQPGALGCPPRFGVQRQKLLQQGLAFMVSLPGGSPQAFSQARSLD